MASEPARTSLLARISQWLAGLALVAGAVWLGWYGYEYSRATTRGLHVIGLLRDVQTCVGLSYEAYQKRLPSGTEFRSIPDMKATPYAEKLDWDPWKLRATATFTDTHPDYDGRTLWIAASVESNGELHWNCGTTVDPGARSYRNVGEFIERCERTLSVDQGIIEYCQRFVPLPARGSQ